MAHNKRLNYMAYLSVLVSACIVFSTAVFVYWLVQPAKLPYIIEPIEILNDNNEIAIGEPVEMKLHIVKTDEVRTTNQTPRIECNSGNLVTLVGSNKDLPIGEYQIISNSYLLPPKVLIGDTCRFYFQTTFEINPIKSVSADWVSEDFKVKE